MATVLKRLNAFKQTINWHLWLSFGFFIIVLIGLFQGTFAIQAWLQKHKDAQITTLKVLGQPYYTQESEIVTAIKRADLTSFFNLDVSQVQDKVQALPWVASVSVRKQWPNTIHVYVVEHTPVAFWNNDGLLNTDGVAFQASSVKVDTTLPKLFGPEGSESEAWQSFLQLQRLLEINQFELVSLALSERFAWQLWLDNGIRLKLGRDEKAHRVQRFIDVYTSIRRPEGAEIDTVDLRYDNGLAVSWVYPQKEQEDKSKA